MTRPVRSLQTLAFSSAVQGVWRRSGAPGPLAEYNHASATHRIGAPRDHRAPDAFLATYHLRINRATAALSHMHYIPEFLVSKLLNFFLSFEKDMAKFSKALSCALEEATIENVRAVLRHIVIDPEGSINRRQTIINIALNSDVDSALNSSLTAYYCIGLDEVLALLAARQEAAGVTEPDLTLEIRLRKSFGSPVACWTARQDVERMQGEFYECVAIHGSTEALAYFLHILPPERRQLTLYRALIYMLNQGMDAEKLIFFYHNLEPTAWKQILKENFCRIFIEFFTCKKYLQMCVLIFCQVYDSLEASEVQALLNFLSVQYYGYNSYPSCCSCSNREQFFNDYDNVFINIWKLIPLQQKKTYGPQIFTIIERFLRYLHMSSIASIIQDKAFDYSEKRNLMSVVHVHLLLKDKEHLMDGLQKRSMAEYTYFPESLSIDEFKLFVALLNRCIDVDRYDYILAKILPSNMTVEDTNSIKQTLLTDKQFISGLVQGVAERHISVGNLHKFILWANLDDHRFFDHYCEHTLFPEKMISDIHKNYMITSWNSIHQLEFFKVHGHWLQAVKRDIAADTETLFQYCYDLIRMSSFRYVGNLLMSIFDTHLEMELFLRSFFRSRKGAEAVYHLVIDDVHDVKYYRRYLFQGKLSAFVEFRENFVWSNDIAVEVRKLLDTYGHPMYAGEVLFNKSYSSLGPESLEAFSLIVDANFNIFRFILNSSALVQIFNHIILQY